MARLKARSIDRNRLTKEYPFVRAPKRMTFFGENDIVIELIVLEFQNESSKRAEFDIPFDAKDYRAAISPRDTGTDSANVNIYIEDSLSDASGITVNSSAPFTGIVDVIIIRISE